tara:strand:+ start:229 stop:357 length:129 start_codon:yes stop_codon:yes gene_type:complete
MEPNHLEFVNLSILKLLKIVKIFPPIEDEVIDNQIKPRSELQ